MIKDFLLHKDKWDADQIQAHLAAKIRPSPFTIP